MRLDKWAVTAQEALQAALGIAGDVEASEVAPTHQELPAVLPGRLRPIYLVS